MDRKIAKIARMIPEEEGKETIKDHLETVLEIITHLWNMLPQAQKQQLDHYRKAIGRANWAAQSESELKSPDLTKVSKIAVRCILEMQIRLEGDIVQGSSAWRKSDINDFAKNALYAIEKTGYDIKQAWE